MNRLNIARGFCIALILTLSACVTANKIELKEEIRLKDSGIFTAKTGEDRYKILYDCHSKAVKLGKRVSYDGIRTLKLEIPKDAAPIPLTEHTDFSGVTFEVTNKSRNSYLFYLTRPLKKINVKGDKIDEGDFTEYPELSAGRCLLVINDKMPWIENRKGYDYGANRKDVTIVRRGKGLTPVVQSYATETSVPECFYCTIDDKPVVLENLTFKRMAASTKITYLVKIENQANVTMSNIMIVTPDTEDKYGDVAITANNVDGLTMKDVTIQGTYSQKNKYGYGVYLNNVSNLAVERMKGHANWGVFGNYNVNRATLKDCNINRFDIHCYGKDVSFENCVFTGLYNQFSSIYGDVKFDRCEFTRFTPLLIEPSFNAYTPFNVSWNDCVFNMDEKHNFLLYLYGLSDDKNPRPELSKKNLPNVDVKNCTMNVTQGVKNVNVIETGLIKYQEPLDYITKIDISGLVINGGEPLLKYFSQKVKTSKTVKLKSRKVVFQHTGKSVRIE